jgi:hypothetical protein
MLSAISCDHALQSGCDVDGSDKMDDEWKKVGVRLRRQGSGRTLID